MLKKGLFLSGYGCQSWIWDDLKKIFPNSVFLDWPKDQLSNFTEINDFCDWVSGYIKNCKFDFLVGHSLGGLVALKLSTYETFYLNKVILIESFLKSPSVFFRNLLNDAIGEDKKVEVIKMLQEQSKFYSPILKDKLVDLDYTSYLYDSKNQIYGIYGDRGTKNEKQVVNELNLSKIELDKVSIQTITNSCHFPMLENPEELKTIINNILKI